MAGYRSLAKHAGVSIDTVLAHSRNDTLKALIETRGGSAQRQIEKRHLERIKRWYDLRVRDILLAAAGSIDSSLEWPQGKPRAHLGREGAPGVPDAARLLQPGREACTS
jgi:hypothetical protein